MSRSKRGVWTNWFEFAFSCLGSMVGLGNVWRFPYICFKNGGGAFLIPYVIFMFTLGMPIVFAEFALAQYSNLGPAKVWLCCPLFKGLGYSMITIVTIGISYYSTIISWTLFYFGNSFLTPMPWTSCDNIWNTDACFLRNFVEQNDTITSDNVTDFNLTHLSANTTLKIKLSSEEFWENRVLRLTKDITTIGSIRWELAVCAFCTWSVAFIAFIKGIKSSGKFMYVASTLPYLFLTFLLIRGLMLPGAVDGIKYFFIPRWKDLQRFSVWSDAAVQVFFSSSLGAGELLTLASHNRFKNNCQSDAILLPIVDTFTSLFAGCVVFATLGYTAHMSDVNIDSVISQGPGMSFMVYPDSLATLPLPQLWSAIFFLLLFIIGINTLVVAIQVLCVGLFDFYPQLLSYNKTAIRLSVCLYGFLTSLLYTTGAGMYILQLVDWYITGISRFFIALVEVTVIGYLYGASRLVRDISIMIGHSPQKIWKYVWLGVTPPLVTALLIILIVNHEPVKYGEKSYPSWSVAIGWVLLAIPFVIILSGAVHTLFHVKGNAGFIERLQQSVKPSKKWMAVEEHELERISQIYSNTNMEKNCQKLDRCV